MLKYGNSKKVVFFKKFHLFLQIVCLLDCNRNYFLRFFLKNFLKKRKGSFNLFTIVP